MQYSHLNSNHVMLGRHQLCHCMVVFLLLLLLTLVLLYSTVLYIATVVPELIIVLLGIVPIQTIQDHQLLQQL